MRSERTATLPEDERVLPELQNEGADSEDLSPFLAFWRSESKPEPAAPSDRSRRGPWMTVDVSPRRAVPQRRPIIERLFSVFALLARHPAFGDPIQAAAISHPANSGPDPAVAGPKARQTR